MGQLMVQVRHGQEEAHLPILVYTGGFGSQLNWTGLALTIVS